MANRFWVGGSGTWDASATANWSTTSGGASGASAPVSTDDAIFDSNSGTGTCTVEAGAVARILNLNCQTMTVSLNSNITLSPAIAAANSYNLQVSGGTLSLNNFTISASRTSFSRATNTRQVNFGTSGKITTSHGDNTFVLFEFNLPQNFTYTGTSNIEFTHSGSSTLFLALPRVSNGATVSHALDYYIKSSSGTAKLDTSTGQVIAGSIDFTGFSGTLTNSNLIVFRNLNYASGMTLSAGTLATQFSATSGTQNISTGGLTLDFPLTFNGSGGAFAFQDALSQGSTRAFTVTNGTVKLKSGVTSTVGSFATSGSSQKFLQSTTPGSVATLSQASGTVSASNLTITDIAATGGATWNAFTTSGNVDGGNNSGWDFSSQLGKFMYARRKNKRILP